MISQPSLPLSLKKSENFFSNEKRRLQPPANPRVVYKNKKLKNNQKKRFQKKAYKAEDYGTVSLRGSKRNIYFTLVDSKICVKSVVSIGYLKAKGKLRRAPHILKKLVKRCVRLLVASKLKLLHLLYSGYFPAKNRKIFTKAFKRQSGFKIYKLTRRQKIPHNGCRRSKKPRK